MKLVYDVESDGLLHNMSLIDCLVIRDVTPEDPDQRKTYRFARHPAGTYELFDGTTVELPERDDIAEGVRMLDEAEFRIGHNIMDFDERAVKKIYPWYNLVRERVLDTLVLARVIMPDTGPIDDKLIMRGKLPGKLRKSHSLDAWGHRLGKHKGDYQKQCIERGWEPWKEWRPDKLDYCVTPNHKILGADLRWRSASDFKVGDKLVGFDEHGPRRKYKESTIESIVYEKRPVYEVVLENGDVIRTTAEHRWLVQHRNAHGQTAQFKWVETRNLRPGLTRVPKIFDVWEEHTTREAGWLAGIMDGEATITPRGAIMVAQNPGDTLERIEAALSNFGTPTTRNVKKDSPCVSIGVLGPLPARLKLIGSVRAERLVSKLCADNFGRLEARNGTTRVKSVTGVGDETIIKIQTSSRTFFCEGYPMHNCVNDVDVTELLWESVQGQLPPPGSVDFERAIHDLTIKMRDNGVPFAVAAARKLAGELDVKKNELISHVSEKYGYWFTAERKRVVAPLFDEDPELSKRPTPMIKARKAAVKKAQEFDASEYNEQTGYFKIRPEFGEDDSRTWWAEVKVAKKTRRAAEIQTAYIAKCDEIEEHNARVEAHNALHPNKPKKFRQYPEPKGSFEFIKVEGGGIYCKNPDTTEGAPYCPIVRKDFNPGSRHHVIDRLMTVHQWQPVDFTETGQPEVSDAVLQRLKKQIPECADLADIFFHNKLLGALRDGDQAWIKAYDKANHPETGENCYALDYCIHGSINVGGTVSGRCAHFAPNLGQVPSVIVEALFDKNGLPDTRFLKDGISFTALPDTDISDDVWEDWPHLWNTDGTLKKKAHILGRSGEYGYECRSLFFTPTELFGIPWKQVGVDLVNVEGRTLAGRMAQFDKGALLDFLINGGDIHTYNMQLTGINDRSLIKRVFFALIYGAGDWKLGITGDSKLSRDAAVRYGKELRALIMAKIPALKKLTDLVQAQARKGYLVGVDGRHLNVRNEYAALNLQLQSDAGLIAKKWAIMAEEALLDAGGRHGWPTAEQDSDFVLMLFVHDELQFAIKEFFAEQGAELICAAAKAAGESFNYCAPIAADAKIGQSWAECH